MGAPSGAPYFFFLLGLETKWKFACLVACVVGCLCGTLMGSGSTRQKRGPLMAEIKIATIGDAGTVYVPTAFTCVECSRVFDMFDETDAEEWHYGHDCEVSE